MSSIDRTKPFTVTWTGGDQKGQAQIAFSAENIDPRTLTGALASVTCTAPVSAGQFTVPPFVLLSLIPNASSSRVSLSASTLQPLTIPGLNMAYGISQNSTGVGIASTVFK